MDNLTVSDRAEWRKILKWPDSCEGGLPDYQKYHSDSGITFNRLAAHEYLVAIGCSGSASVFIYYRENTSQPPLLLKFREYDAASGNAAAAYSTVRSLFPAEFKPRRNVLEIFFTDQRDRCRAHYYRSNKGRPILLKTARCGLLIEPMPPPRATPNKSGMKVEVKHRFLLPAKVVIDFGGLRLASPDGGARLVTELLRATNHR